MDVANQHEGFSKTYSREIAQEDDKNPAGKNQAYDTMRKLGVTNWREKSTDRAGCRNTISTFYNVLNVLNTK